MKKKVIALMISIIYILNIGLMVPIYADSKVKISQIKGSVAAQGDNKANVIVEIQNTGSDTLKSVKAKISSGELTYAPYSDEEVTIGSIEAGVKKTASWSMNISGLELEKMYKMPVTVSDESGTIGQIDATIYVARMNEEFEKDPQKTYNPQVALNVGSDKLASGQSGNVTLRVSNIGNAPLLDVTATIGPLSENISLKNSSTEIRLGSIGTSRGEKTAQFPIYIDEKHEGGNIPFSFTVKGKDPNGKEATFTKTEYISVSGNGSVADNISIGDISGPDTVSPGKDFNVSFTVSNNGASELKNLKVMLDPTSPVVNKSKNIFVVNIKPHEKKNFKVTLFSASNTEAKNYPIKISTETSGKDPKTLSQYTGIYVKGDTSTKTVPQLMVEDYNYGGSSVNAGSDFRLNLRLKNTNKIQGVKNIKISFNSEEGIFLPENSSNSMYIDNIPANSSISESILLKCKSDAPQKTVSVNVDMSYEDKNGNPVSSKDIISIPVSQKIKLTIDDIVPPTEIYKDQQLSASVQYYNMGKTAISNLRITAEGEGFKFSQPPSQYVGNFDAGKNNYYDLTITPEKEGEIGGKIIFTFENASGESQKIEKEFKFTALSAPPVEPKVPENEENSKKGGFKGLIPFGIGGGVIILGITLYKKHKKAKYDKELDIEE